MDIINRKKKGEDMMTPILDERQKDLEQIVAEALKDNNLIEALEAYEMGQAEYVRAVAASVTIQLSSGNTSNPGNLKEHEDANVDRD